MSREPGVSRSVVVMARVRGAVDALPCCAATEGVRWASSAGASSRSPMCSDVTPRSASDRDPGNARPIGSGRAGRHPFVSGRASARPTTHGPDAHCRSPGRPPACLPSPTQTRTATDPRILVAACRSTARQTDATAAHTAHSSPRSPAAPAGWRAIGETDTAGRCRS